MLRVCFVGNGMLCCGESSYVITNQTSLSFQTPPEEIWMDPQKHTYSHTKTSGGIRLEDEARAY